MLQTFLFYLLRKLASGIIKKYHPDVIGITGSIGKTSTKEAIACVLKSKFPTRASYKNYNNEIGVPLTIIGVKQSPRRSIIGWLAVLGKGISLICIRDKEYPQMLVLEMGADKLGDIQYLTSMAPCNVGVLTYISHAHTEFFKTIKKIAQEKRIIISHLQRDGFAILNFDNALVMENANVTKAEIITYGFKSGADYQVSDLKMMATDQGVKEMGLNFKVNYRGNSVPIFLPGSISKSVVPSVLAAIAVGGVYGINLVEAAQALKELAPLPGHMRPIDGIKHTLLIDDTYNSSPDPARVALEVLASMSLGDGAIRYAVLGDMLELGSETLAAHRAVGFKVAELGIDYLITVGEASKGTAAAAIEAGIDENRVASFDLAPEAGKFLQDKMKRGDIVLIKGSQGSRMEKVVKEVMAEPEKAKELLVRQEEFWLQK